MSKDYQKINGQIREVTKGGWATCFEFHGDGGVAVGEERRYRHELLMSVFSSLLPGYSMLALDAVSGLDPILAMRSGAKSVSANCYYELYEGLVASVTEVAGVGTNLIKGRLLYFHDSNIYLNADHRCEWDILFGQSTVWKYYYSFERSFDLIVEACAYYVREGLILEWEPAGWADPPVPPEYCISELCVALRKRFAYVVAVEKAFVVAVGKLPEQADTPGQ